MLVYGDFCSRIVLFIFDVTSQDLLQLSDYLSQDSALTGSVDAYNPVCMKFFTSSDELAAYLADNPLCGATILIKGSRGTRMEKVIPVL